MQFRPENLARASTASRRSRVARVLAVVLAVLQLAMGSAVPLLDADAAHHQPVAAHIEDASQENCPASHDAASCQLCQVLTAARGLPTAPALPSLPVVERDPQIIAVQTVAVASAFLDGLGSRAPPLG